MRFTSKSIQDRYSKLQAAFDKRSAKYFKMSEMAGEVGEIEELLPVMQERDDLDRQQKAGTQAKKERDEQKERLGN